MIRTYIISGAVFLLPVLALAEDSSEGFTDMMKAREFAQIVASSDSCRYELDQDKTADLVSTFIASGDALRGMAYQSARGAQAIRLKEMSPTDLAVTCATQEKLADKYGMSK